MSKLLGSICLSDIPKSQMKKVKLKDGSEKIYVNVFIGELKTPKKFGKREMTHYVSCAPKKEEREEGVNYFIGDLFDYVKEASKASVSVEQVNSAPSVEEDDDLPF